jgi:MoaA/NifB/PqqE/SkfB family radical SAM enzyme
MRKFNLDDIGFYTLSDYRAKNASAHSALQRGELILTGRCNFQCPYCRSVGGDDLPRHKAGQIVKQWAEHGLANIRFSGGEPTLWPGLDGLVRYSKWLGIKRIAISTNGSAGRATYADLLNAGVDDFSISLDACCAEDGDKMAGGRKGSWNTVVDNLRWISERAYTTVGVVLTEDNEESVGSIVDFAADCGVSDIRIIPAAQHSRHVRKSINPEKAKQFPILKYRISAIESGLPVRGIYGDDSSHCGLVLDDVVAMGENHYPCIIYLRECGKPIGRIGDNFRKERRSWFETHNTKNDPICSANCLDFCVHYNNTFMASNACAL